jgi:WD40 repeat protein
VYSLDWCADSSLILSAGLDHDVFIWNPHVQKRIFVLKGHNHSLVGVKWMPGTHQIISADVSGMFRIWDVRTFTTVQTFNCPTNEINCFAITQPPKRIIAGGRRMFFYDYDEPTDNHLADDQHCLCVLYNPVFYTFVTAHPKCIKVWDATNGCLQSVYRDITSKDITSMCFDKRQRKLFVGDQKGRIYCINVKNGAKMKKFKKPERGKKDKEDVSSMVYWYYMKEEEQTAHCNVISGAWDGVLRLWDDNNTDREG